MSEIRITEDGRRRGKPTVLGDVDRVVGRGLFCCGVRHVARLHRHVPIALPVRGRSRGRRPIHPDARWARVPLLLSKPHVVELDLLTVDDVGPRPLERDEPIDLYEIIRQRYERGAMILTSSRDVDEWAALFNDALLASAAIDRRFTTRRSW